MTERQELGSLEAMLFAHAEPFLKKLAWASEVFLYMPERIAACRSLKRALGSAFRALMCSRRRTPLA